MSCRYSCANQNCQIIAMNHASKLPQGCTYLLGSPCQKMMLEQEAFDYLCKCVEESIIVQMYQIANRPYDHCFLGSAKTLYTVSSMLDAKSYNTKLFLLQSKSYGGDYSNKIISGQVQKEPERTLFLLIQIKFVRVQKDVLGRVLKLK